jgi:hypothetical protein
MANDNFNNQTPEDDLASNDLNRQPEGSQENSKNTAKGGEEIMEAPRKVSNSELKKKRLVYYAAKRSVDSLENKRMSLITIIKTGKKERVKIDKETKDKIIETVKLNTTQLNDEKRRLAEVDLELEMARDGLKKKDYGFSKAAKSKTDVTVSKKQAYREKRAESRIEDVKALVNSAVFNSGFQDVVDIQKMAGEGATLKDIKPRLMKVVRKENRNGYPIRNVSDKTVEIIMAGLLNWNTETSDQPFKIS